MITTVGIRFCFQTRTVKRRKMIAYLVKRVGKLTLNRTIYLTLSGLIILTLGFYLKCYGFYSIIRNSVHYDRTLVPNITLLPVSSIGMNMLDFSVYLFNVTNPDEILRGGKPILKEVGPFIFMHEIRKRNLKSFPDDTMTYFNDHLYLYQSYNARNVNLREKIVLLNVILIGTADIIERRFPDKIKVFNESLPSLFPKLRDIFIQTTAREILLDSNGFKISCGTSNSAKEICRILDTMAPLTLKNNKNEGPYKIRRGAKDYKALGKVIAFKNKTYLPEWPKNSACSSVKGFDFSYIPPFLNKEDIRIYMPDVFSFTYFDKGEYDGLFSFYKFKSSEKNFGSVEVPGNECRCLTSKEFCLKKGAFEAFSCQGFPFVYSEPHFYRGDPSYLSYIHGLHPNEEDHSSYLHIEPITGIAVKRRMRLQINMKLNRIGGIKILANVSEGLFPIAWYEEGENLPSLAEEELTLLYNLLNNFHALAWVIIFVGILLLLFISALLVFKKGLKYKKNGSKM